MHPYTWVFVCVHTWLSEQQLSHSLRATGRVLSNTLIKSFIRLHQTQNLQVAPVLKDNNCMSKTHLKSRSAFDCVGDWHNVNIQKKLRKAAVNSDKEIYQITKQREDLHFTLVTVQHSLLQPAFSNYFTIHLLNIFIISVSWK